MCCYRIFLALFKSFLDKKCLQYWHLKQRLKLSVDTVNCKVLLEIIRVLKDILERKKLTTIRADLNELNFSHCF